MKRILTAAAAVLLCACSVQAETPVQTASQPVLSETVVQTEETEQPAQPQTETSTDASQTENTDASQTENTDASQTENTEVSADEQE